MAIPEHEEVHYLTVQGGFGDLTGAVLHVTRPACGLKADFIVKELVSDNGKERVYRMVPDKQ